MPSSIASIERLALIRQLANDLLMHTIDHAEARMAQGVLTKEQLIELYASAHAQFAATITDALAEAQRLSV